MAKKKHQSSGQNTLKEILSLYSQIADLKQQFRDVSHSGDLNEERIMSLEVHINLLTRLLTTLCVEKFGLRVGTLKKLVRRIERETVRDSQIHELESLYKLSSASQKKKPTSADGIAEDLWGKTS